MQSVTLAAMQLQRLTHRPFMQAVQTADVAQRVAALVIAEAVVADYAIMDAVCSVVAAAVRQQQVVELVVVLDVVLAAAAKLLTAMRCRVELLMPHPQLLTAHRLSKVSR